MLENLFEYCRFFCCNFEGESEDAIHQVLADNGSDQIRATLAKEMPTFVSLYDLKENEIIYPNRLSEPSQPDQKDGNTFRKRHRNV